MKLKAGRSQLAAILTAAFVVSLFPVAPAVSATNQPQQADSSSRPRRGKNGEPVTKSADNQETPQAPDPEQDSKPDTTKPTSSAQPVQQQPAAAGHKGSPSAGQPARTSSPPDSGQSQQQSEAPPFDRPPIGAQGRSGRDSTDLSREASRPIPQRPAYSTDRSGEASRPTSERPSYSGERPTYSGDSRSRGDSRGQSSNRSQSSTSAGSERDRYPETSTGTDVDPEPTSRAGGRPPVLQRPADSRPRDDGSSPDERRPPVLHRSTDPEPGDGGNSNSSAGRRSSSGQQPQGAGHQQSGGEDDVIKLESTLINIPLLVSDRSGRYVPQLSKNDFAL